MPDFLVHALGGFSSFVPKLLVTAAAVCATLALAWLADGPRRKQRR